MKSYLDFLALVLIVGIVFYSIDFVDTINSNVVKPKFNSIIKQKNLIIKPKEVKSIDLVQNCASEGKPSVIPGCCKNLVDVNGICKKIIIQKSKITPACAGNGQKISFGQKCCENFEPINFVCKPKLPKGLLPSSPPGGIPNPLTHCGGLDEPPSFSGCCKDLVNKNGKCVYPYPCARHGQKATEYNNRCCGEEVVNSQGVCVYNSCGEIWQRASDHSGVNYGCCPGYAPDSQGVCKEMGCAVEGSVHVHYARGCCRGLEPDSGICMPPCAKENEREMSKEGGCCYMLVADDYGICKSVEMGGPPNPLGGMPSPY